MTSFIVSKEVSQANKAEGTQHTARRKLTDSWLKKKSKMQERNKGRKQKKERWRKVRGRRRRKENMTRKRKEFPTAREKGEWRKSDL